MEDNLKYLFETHAHTSEISPCSQVCASDVIIDYHKKGYDGVIITDHVGNWSFDMLTGTWKDKIDLMVKAYKSAKKMGDRLGVKVLFGMEAALSNPYRDYLVYGFDYDFLYQYENIHEMNLEKFYRLAQENDFILIAAHPLRYDRNSMDARYLDGVEIYNGNPRKNNNNDKALKWANKNNMIKLAGSDYHQHGDISAGVYLPLVPDTIKEFVEIIKSGNYELIP